MSSSITARMFGAPSGARGSEFQAGSAWSTVGAITPRNGGCVGVASRPPRCVLVDLSKGCTIPYVPVCVDAIVNGKG